MIWVLNFPLVLLLLSEAICLFLFLINETLLRILRLSLEFSAEKVLKSKEFLILLHSLKLFCLCKFFSIRFGKTLVSQSEVDLRVFFLLFVLGLEIDILLVLVSEYNPSAIENYECYYSYSYPELRRPVL